MRTARAEHNKGVESRTLGRDRRLQRMVLKTGATSVVLFDTMRIALAYTAVLVLRFDGAVPGVHWDRFLRFIPIAIAAHLATNWRFRLYEQVWRHASVVEAVRLVEASLLSMVVLLAVDAFNTPRVPISVVVGGSVATALVTGASRFQARLLASLNRRRRSSTGTAVALIGAGEETASLIRAMRSDVSPVALTAVAVLADDPADHGRSLLGVPVLGSIEQLPQIVERLGITYALLATTETTRDLVRRSVDAAEASGIPLKLVPDVQEVLRAGVSVTRAARDVSIEDLLGREQVRTDLDAVRRTVTGRRVLITGAGGSIGSEIARQIAELEPSELVLLDHDETHLFDAAGAIRWPSRQVLADIRDEEVVLEVFAEHHPDVVFHAAAHKHVPLLEAHPCEAVRTNVIGTRNVLRAAAKFGAHHLVFISTDKAVDPSNVMGSSKLLGERLVQRHAPAGARWCAVRFGNVLGSRGSVIPVFARQIAQGGPVTVTHPEMNRYFMSTEEAVQLVLQVTTLAQGGDTFLLDMGEPVNILALARKMIRLSGYAPGTDIPIVITGTRPGEKLDEHLHSVEETELPTAHTSINRVIGPAVDLCELDAAIDKLVELASARDEENATAVLLDLPRRWASYVEGPEGVDLWNSTST